MPYLSLLRCALGMQLLPRAGPCCLLVEPPETLLCLCVDGDCL